uniref:Developmentally regulated GTP binding protein 2 n=1 Tax=Sus scrofa TaxID=9823 RepID=A0A8D1TJ96_PIG
MGILEKISEIEKEIARTQKNKATEYHLGLLKAKLAKYRAQLLEPSKSASSKGEGFDVMKSGDARVALIGFPSVGKSTFLSLMTSTASEAASYEFTTLTCIPGVIEYKGANIQLLDLPGIIEGAAQGKGRGRQVIAVARTADVVIMMLDATKGEAQRSLLEKELESVGIRLNKHKPNIYFKPKKGGGISFNSTVTLTQCSEKLVQLILHEYKIFNAEVLFREDCSPDEFIDVIVGNRVYMPCLYVYNKIDQISMEEVDRLARKPDSVVISCGMKLNLDYLLEVLWEYLALTCIYTKKRGQRPDFTDAIILRKGASVEHVCHRIHRSLASQFKYALVWVSICPRGMWPAGDPGRIRGGQMAGSPAEAAGFAGAGTPTRLPWSSGSPGRVGTPADGVCSCCPQGTSTKYSPQRVGLTHTVEHEDVIQIVKK